MQYYLQAISILTFTIKPGSNEIPGPGPTEDMQYQFHQVLWRMIPLLEQHPIYSFIKILYHIKRY